MRLRRGEGEGVKMTKCPSCGSHGSFNVTYYTKGCTATIDAVCVKCDHKFSVPTQRRSEMEPEKLEHLCSMHRFQVAQALAVPCMQCYIDRLTAENAELREDKARLDFLDETNQSFYWPEDQPVRAAIDAAKEGE